MCGQKGVECHLAHRPEAYVPTLPESRGAANLRQLLESPALFSPLWKPTRRVFDFAILAPCPTLARPPGDPPPPQLSEGGTYFVTAGMSLNALLPWRRPTSCIASRPANSRA